MSLLALSGTNSVSGGYEIDNSLKFERANSEQIYTSNAASGNRKTWTFSAWIKRTELSQDYHTIFSAGYTNIQIMSNDRPRLVLYDGTSYYADPEMLMRDTAAWYHIVVQLDTTQSTAADRVKWWINGDRITDFNNSTYTNMSQNDEFEIGQAGSGSADWLRLGEFFGGSEGFSGYMSDVYYLNGTAAQASDFGEYDDDSGIWIPKKYTGSGYGTQGFKYEFKDSSALGTDTSGEGHNANNLGNITAADQATDTPTNNFCTLLGKQQASVVGTEPSIKEGGTTMFGGVSGTQNAIGTMGVRNGKWYFESTITNSGGVGTENHNFGVATTEEIATWSTGSGRDIGYISTGWACASNSAPRNNNATATNANTTSALAVDKIMGVAVDMDNGKIWWHREGTWTSINSTVGNPANGTAPAFSNLLTATTEHLIPAGGFYVNDGNQIRVMNFGGYAQAVFTAVGTYTDANGYGSFAYQPPTGYYALCTKNLAEYG